jgi:hypothetical protein
MHADELVGIAAAGVGVADDLLEFLIEESVAEGPVDAGMDAWKEQREELRKVAFEGLFPGAVVVAARRALGGVGHAKLL